MHAMEGAGAVMENIILTDWVVSADNDNKLFKPPCYYIQNIFFKEFSKNVDKFVSVYIVWIQGIQERSW